MMVGAVCVVAALSLSFHCWTKAGISAKDLNKKFAMLELSQQCRNRVKRHDFP